MDKLEKLILGLSNKIDRMSGEFSSLDKRISALETRNTNNGIDVNAMMNMALTLKMVNVMFH